MSAMSDIVQDSKLRTMSAAGGDSKESMSELLNWNNLTYKMPITNSVVSARNVKKYPADRNTYSWGASGTNAAGPIFFHLQAGLEFVDWGKSFIELSLDFKAETATATTTTKLGFGLGSVCNLISEVIVTTRSGTEIHRIEAFNRYRALHDRLTRSPEWFKTVGKLMGYSSDPDYYKFRQCGMTTGLVDKVCMKDVGIAEISDTAAGVTKTFLIPLDALGGPFATGQLSPAVLAG